MFWRKLAENGLITGMIDGNSNPIYVDGQWMIDNLDPEDYPDPHAEMSATGPNS